MGRKAEGEEVSYQVCLNSSPVINFLKRENAEKYVESLLKDKIDVTRSTENCWLFKDPLITQTLSIREIWFSDHIFEGIKT